MSPKPFKSIGGNPINPKVLQRKVEEAEKAYVKLENKKLEQVKTIDNPDCETKPKEKIESNEEVKVIEESKKKILPSPQITK